ncbi:MAG: hypothetical protein IT323_07855, partial [Anaerolineae bacterium]|nr:hypothetical protein [Anaerolineae bacterium]
DKIRARIDAAGDTAPQVGVAIAVELLEELQGAGMIQGAYLIPPFGKYEMAADIVEAIKAKV